MKQHICTRWKVPGWELWPFLCVPRWGIDRQQVRDRSVERNHSEADPVLFVNTGKNNWFPFLDILGYLKNTRKNPKLMAKWDKSQPGNSQPSSLVGTCLTLPNLGFWWVFFKYPKISKNGNPLFFPLKESQGFTQVVTYLKWFLWVHWW